jgi:hypothetical protein
MKRRLTTVLISLISFPLFGQNDLSATMTHDFATNAVYNSGNSNSPEVTRRLQKLANDIAEQHRFTAALLEAYSTVNTAPNRRTRLLQNAPSHFHHVSTIHFQLPEDVLNASIKVHDSNGKSAASFPDIRNRAHVTIEANSLTPGVYYYSLLINDKVCETKKLILTRD